MNIQDFHQLQEAYVNIYEKRRSEESGEDHPEDNEKNERRQKLERKKKDKERYHQESVDYYDLVLSHLLDEGYADSEANAEIIMVNMSEEWLDEILNEVVGMGSKIDPKTGKHSPDFETDLKYKDGWKDNRTKSQKAYDDKTPKRSKYVRGTTGSQYREFEKSKDPGLAMTPDKRMESRAKSLSRRSDVESRRRGSKIERIRQNLGLG